MPDKPSGILFVNKPYGLTSHDVVRRVRKIFSTPKVGHTGTLDPMATGMLPIVIGDATRFANYLLCEKKCYRSTIQLGSKTTTDDALGETIAQTSIPSLSQQHIHEILKNFTGNITQTVPRYCALHLNGQRMYQLARKGIDFTPPKRNITVHHIKWLSYEPSLGRLHIEFTVSSGTYIRSLARDIGDALNCYGHLSALERLWIQPYMDQKTATLNQESTPETMREAWVPLDDMPIDIESVSLNVAQAIEIAHGRTINSPTHCQSPAVAVKLNGKLLGICHYLNEHLIVKRLRSHPLDWVQKNL